MLEIELFEFDILAFTESWLIPSHSTKDILITSFNEPERKYQVCDSHGVVINYVKDSIHYRQRNDLEPLGIECNSAQQTCIFLVFLQTTKFFSCFLQKEFPD